MRAAGDRVDRYVLESLLGRGGMGEVYVARDERLERRVALKLLQLGADETARARMMREARTVAAFEHPNAVVVFDVGETFGTPFIAMELIRGTSLRRLVGDSTTPRERRLRWLVEIARALGAAHRAGIVHRDVKPDNVMIREDGAVKVLDFGIARRFEARPDASAPTISDAPLATLTAEGAIVGTPLYLSPEQLSGGEVDGRADQFAWGVLAYELLTGETPWGTQEAVLLVGRILAQEITALRDRAPDLSTEVEAVVVRALSKRPGDRFASLDEAADALEPFAEVASRPLARPPSSSAPTATREAERAATAERAPVGATNARRTPPARWPARVAMLAVAVGLVWGVRWYAIHPSAAPRARDVTEGVRVPASQARVAVLPFENLTKDPADEWLGVGLAEAIAGKLAAQGIEIARRSDEDAGAHADGASVIVTGTYAKTGGEIRVTLRAADASRAEQILVATEQHGPATAIFDLQDALAATVARALSRDHTEGAGAPKTGTRNMVAFEAYARGLGLLAGHKIPEAMAQFNRAVAADPEFTAPDAALRRIHKDSIHHRIAADGVETRTVHFDVPAEAVGPAYGLTTNQGNIAHAWDDDGTALKVTAKPQPDGETTFELWFPPDPKHPAARRVPQGIFYEQESPERAKMGEGLVFHRSSFSTNPKAGEKTFVFELPPNAKILAVTPIPVESSDGGGKPFLLLREWREPMANYVVEILFTTDAEVEARYTKSSIAERAAWILRARLRDDDHQASRLARLTEPSRACQFASKGKIAEATHELGVVERSEADYGPFLAGLSRACVAIAEGRDAAAAEDLDRALAAPARYDELVSDAYVDEVRIAVRAGNLEDAERHVRREIDRTDFWERGAFHRGMPEGGEAAFLEERLAAEPENVAVRYDLALSRWKEGRLDDAARLVEGREESAGRPYVLDLEARIAIRRGDAAQAANALQAFARIFPLRDFGAYHATMLALSGRAPEGLAWLDAHGDPASENALLALEACVSALEAPLAEKSKILKFVDDAPELFAGRPFRIMRLARLIRAADASRSRDRAELVASFAEDLEGRVERGKAGACDKECMSSLAKDACGAHDLPSKTRQWLASSGARCAL